MLSCQEEPPLSAHISLQCCSLSHNIAFPLINFFVRISKALEMPMLFLMDLDKGALRSEKPCTSCKTKLRNASFMGPEPQPQQDHPPSACTLLSLCSLKFLLSKLSLQLGKPGLGEGWQLWDVTDQLAILGATDNED